MILAIRTDKPEAEIYLLDVEGKPVAQDVWLADRQLSLQLNSRIDKLLQDNKLEYKDLTGVLAFKGTGSFTGLRIGLTVANAVAYSLDLPIAAAGGDDWLKEAAKELENADPGGQVLPEYGGEANITKPRK